MKQSVYFLVRGIVLMQLAMLLIIGFHMIVSLHEGHLTFAQLGAFSPAGARELGKSLNGNFNQIFAIAFTAVAIAVPLTANMYSLKFLEFFVKDRVNGLVLGFVAVADLNNTWMTYSIKENYVPVFQLNLSLALAITSFALMVPYLYYVFRFLHPHTLLLRLEQEIVDRFKDAARRPARIPQYRIQVAEGVEHVANIAIRSIDRSDRSTAIESVLCLERLARTYWSLKSKLAPAWFDADANSFLGFSSSAIDELKESQNWIEMKVFFEMRQILSSAISRTHDVISSIAKVLRKLGVDNAARMDRAVSELVMEFFNTFVRLAIQRKDTRSVFITFDQYRTYATLMNQDRPELVLEIAYYFEYYGESARDSQLPFVVESVAHDLGSIVQHAWETNAPNREKLLSRFLHYDSKIKSPLPGVKKAHAILASYFLMAGHTEPVHLIRQSFAELDEASIRSLTDDLLHVKRKKYWEINERRTNMDYVPDPQRVKLQEFLESLLPGTPT